MTVTYMVNSPARNRTEKGMNWSKPTWGERKETFTVQWPKLQTRYWLARGPVRPSPVPATQVSLIFYTSEWPLASSLSWYIPMKISSNSQWILAHSLPMLNIASSHLHVFLPRSYRIVPRESTLTKPAWTPETIVSSVNDSPVRAGCSERSRSIWRCDNVEHVSGLLNNAYAVEVCITTCWNEQERTHRSPRLWYNSYSLPLHETVAIRSRSWLNFCGYM